MAPPAIGRRAPFCSLRLQSWSLYVGHRPTRRVMLRGKVESGVAPYVDGTYGLKL